MKLGLLQSVVLLTCSMQPGVLAWWDTGHLIIARIAYNILQEKSPETITQINDILMPLEQ